MIIRAVGVLIEILVLYLLQTSVFTSFALAGVVPNLLLVLVCAVGFMRGRIPALLTGFVSGLVLDCTFGNIIGAYALIYMTIGYLAGYSHAIYDENDYTLPILITAAGQFIYDLAYFFVFYLLRGKLNIGHFFLRYMVPGLIYTILIETLLYKLINMANVFLMRFDRD